MSNRNEHRAARSGKLILSTSVGCNRAIPIMDSNSVVTSAQRRTRRLVAPAYRTVRPRRTCRCAMPATPMTTRTASCASFSRHPISGSATAARYRPNRSRHLSSGKIRSSTRPLGKLLGSLLLARFPQARTAGSVALVAIRYSSRNAGCGREPHGSLWDGTLSGHRANRSLISLCYLSHTASLKGEGLR